MCILHCKIKKEICYYSPADTVYTLIDSFLLPRVLSAVRCENRIRLIFWNLVFRIQTFRPTCFRLPVWLSTVCWAWLVMFETKTCQTILILARFVSYRVLLRKYWKFVVFFVSDSKVFFFFTTGTWISWTWSADTTRVKTQIQQNANC